ncbi:hypothetical protein [Tenacibaculum sp.]|uniref:hypothetical protein n=1 Tax=Tenacibaculum sp. TaxID=1906242 RepID=UPI003D1442CB
MQTSDYIAIGSLVLSAVALVYAYMSSTKKYELHSQYRSEILKWYDETNQVLIRLKLEAQNDFPNKDLKIDLLSTLSAKIELGRFYFPNVTNGISYGSDKPKAYQGFRNLNLDFLVFSYRLFDKDNAKTYLHHAEALQRYFTSHVFEIVEPRKFLKETEKYTSKAFSKDVSFEDFLDKEPELIIEYIKDY